MKVVIYSKKGCPYCSKAIQLLKNNNIIYTEYQLDPSDNDYTENRNRIFHDSNHYSFPVIYFGNKLIGGCSELEKRLINK